jgi:hypothetical protein
VAGYDLVGRIGYPDQGPFELFFGVTHGLEKRAVRGFFHPFFHKIASHEAFLPSVGAVKHGAKTHNKYNMFRKAGK